MKVLWLCNLIPPQAGEILGISGIPKEGWVEGLMTAMASKASEVSLAIAFPVSEEHDGKRDTFVIGDDFEFTFFAFREDTVHPETFDPSLEGRMNRILDEFHPDVVHIFGTEFPHALAMGRAVCGDDFHYHPGRDRLLITFQGICAAVAADYMACLPDEIVSSTTFRDTVKKDSIKQQQEKFQARARNELEAAGFAGYLGGRTSFDKKWATRLGPEAKYRYAGEVMRAVFYEPLPTDINRDTNTIFVSGADYPLKGFHILLRALMDINWPELKIRVAGQNIVSRNTLKEKVKISEYGKYLGELIERGNLQGKVEFLGRISAEQMREEYLKCGMYICPSSVENSPNSIVEASLCEAPVIASRVGGIPDIIEDKKECLLYDCNARKPLDEVAASLRGCIEAVMADPEAAKNRAKAARQRALKEHDPETVAAQMIGIYTEMCGRDS